MVYNLWQNVGWSEGEDRKISRVELIWTEKGKRWSRSLTVWHIPRLSARTLTARSREGPAKRPKASDLVGKRSRCDLKRDFGLLESRDALKYTWMHSRHVHARVRMQERVQHVVAHSQRYGRLAKNQKKKKRKKSKTKQPTCEMRTRTTYEGVTRLLPISAPAFILFAIFSSYSSATHYYNGTLFARDLPD